MTPEHLAEIRARDAELAGFQIKRTEDDRRKLLAYVDELEAERGQLLQLVADLADPDDCRFDHHGGCQAHGYLSLEPGQLCPHAEAKQVLARHPEIQEAP